MRTPDGLLLELWLRQASQTMIWGAWRSRPRLRLGGRLSPFCSGIGAEDSVHRLGQAAVGTAEVDKIAQTVYSIPGIRLRGHEDDALSGDLIPARWAVFRGPDDGVGREFVYAHKEGEARSQAGPR